MQVHQVLRAVFQRTLGRIKKKIRVGAIQLVANCGLRPAELRTAAAVRVQQRQILFISLAAVLLGIAKTEPDSAWELLSAAQSSRGRLPFR